MQQIALKNNIRTLYVLLTLVVPWMLMVIQNVAPQLQHVLMIVNAPEQTIALMVFAHSAHQPALRILNNV
jgi:hypothetical protein